MLEIFHCSLVVCDYKGHTKEIVAIRTVVAVSVVARALTSSRLARSGNGARNRGPSMSLQWSKTRKVGPFGSMAEAGFFKCGFSFSRFVNMGRINMHCGWLMG